MKFLHILQKILVFHEIWHAHIDCRDVHAIYLWSLCHFEKNPVVGAYSPMWQSECLNFVTLLEIEK